MKRILEVVVVMVVMFDVVTSSYAGSERLIMAMSAARMDQGNLVYVKFVGPDGAA